MSRAGQQAALQLERALGMGSKKIVVTGDQAGKRADKFLAFLYPQFARSAVHKLFEHRQVIQDGEPIKAGEKLREGDVLEVEDQLLMDEPPAIDIPVIFENNDVVVINKPVGILAHSKGSFNPEATVASWLRDHIGADQTASNREGIVHRLDRTTSGVMIMAKNPDAQSWLQKQFAQRRVKKTYIAIVDGKLPEKEAVIDMPIERNPANPKTFRVSKTGKPSLTRVKVLTETPTHSVLELRPETGRTHQLRVHLKAIGHPIVGDTLYGAEPAVRIYLHALELELTLPTTHDRVTYTAPLPSEFSDGGVK